MKTFKQMTCVIAAALMAAGMMTSCSGGGNTPAKDGPLGKLPTLYKEAGEKAYETLNKLTTATTEDEGKKILEDLKAMKEQMEKDITETFETMNGKEIPTEVSEEVPMKLTSPLTLTKMESAEYGKFKLEADVEMTKDVSFYKKGDIFPYSMIRAIYVDADGKPLYNEGKAGIAFDGQSNDGVYPAGTKGHLTLNIRIEDWNAEQYANMDKVRFVLFDTDIQKQAQVINDSLKEIDKARQREFWSKVKVDIK